MSKMLDTQSTHLKFMIICFVLFKEINIVISLDILKSRKWVMTLKKQNNHTKGL